jgi:hypothetical protein
MLKTLFAFFALVVSFAAAAAAPGPNPLVEVRTNMGSFTIELYPENAPNTVQNFIQYVKDGHYNGTLFHRVMPGFMIQGGGFDQKFEEKPTRAPIKNEAGNGLRNGIGMVSMARTKDAHSATAKPRRRRATVTHPSGKSSKAWTWSSASPRSPPVPANRRTPTCPANRSSSSACSSWTRLL